MRKKKVRLSPPPTQIDNIGNYSWRSWFKEIRERVGEGPLKLQGYVTTSLPNPQDYGSINPDDPFSSLIFVYDVPAIAYSDGTDWINITTGTAI